MAKCFLLPITEEKNRVSPLPERGPSTGCSPKKLVFVVTAGHDGKSCVMIPAMGYNLTTTLHHDKMLNYEPRPSAAKEPV